MEITYKNKRVQKQFASAYYRKWIYPENVKQKLLAMETFICKATSLKDIANYKPYHFHQLHGERQAEWSLYVGNTGYRVTVFPCNEEWQLIQPQKVLEICHTIHKLKIMEVSHHYE